MIVVVVSGIYIMFSEDHCCLYQIKCFGVVVVIVVVVVVVVVVVIVVVVIVIVVVVVVVVVIVTKHDIGNIFSKHLSHFLFLSFPTLPSPLSLN